MAALPLLKRFAPDDALRFAGAAVALAGRLPRKRHVLNLCEDRGRFLLGFAAALIARQVTLLPSSRAPGVLEQVYESHGDAYCLTDHDDVPAGLEAFRLDAFPETAAATRMPVIPEDRIAAIVFTSGTTGAPMPHPKTWGALVAGAEALGRQLGLESGRALSVLGTVPPQHMFGLETTVMFPLQWGGAVHPGRPLFPADIRAALEELPAPRWLMTTPLHLRACLGEGVVLPGLEGVISATMPLDPDLAAQAENLWQAPVHEIYGCTEAGMVAMRRPAQGETWRLCDGMRIRQDGEGAWIEGGHVPQPLRLGDRIALHGECEFTLLGRDEDLIKIGGKRMSLAALNLELARIGGVRDGVFYLPPEVNGGGRLIAFVVAPGMTAVAILAELRRRIDPVFLPRPLLLVETLPRNATGKLPRENLRRFAAERLGNLVEPV